MIYTLVALACFLEVDTCFARFFGQHFLQKNKTKREKKSAHVARRSFSNTNSCLRVLLQATCSAVVLSRPGFFVYVCCGLRRHRPSAPPPPPTHTSVRRIFAKTDKITATLPRTPCCKRSCDKHHLRRDFVSNFSGGDRCPSAVKCIHTLIVYYLKTSACNYMCVYNGGITVLLFKLHMTKKGVERTLP